MNVSIRYFNYIFLIYIFISISSSGQLFAQEASDTLKFIYPKEKSTSIRFEFINNLIVIPVSVNNSDTLRFILDTGLRTSIITELSMGDTLSLEYAKEMQLHGLGKGEPLDALYSKGNTLSISRIVGSNQDLYVLLQNIFHLSTKLGTRIHGLLGYSVFKNFIIEINYQKKIITFHNPKYYNYKKDKKASTIPLTVQNTKPYVILTITTEDGSEIPVKLLIDTGAGHALWLDADSNEEISLPNNTIDSFLGSGLNGEIHGKIGRIKKLTIGKHEFNDIITLFPDSTSMGSSRGRDKRNGSLGTDVLHRFNIIIDYHNELMTLKPNMKFNKPFNYNMSGIEIAAPIPELPFYTIINIRKDSPADRAGLKKGDGLYKLNHFRALDLSLNDIYKLFLSKAGKKMKIIVLRNGMKYKTIFFLEKLI